jgi:hypothetical protein
MQLAIDLRDSAGISSFVDAAPRGQIVADGARTRNVVQQRLEYEVGATESDLYLSSRPALNIALSQISEWLLCGSQFHGACGS